MFLIIPITPEQTEKNEPGIVTELFEAGLKILHVRKPTMSYQEMKDYLNQIPKRFHSRIVIHSNYRLCQDFHLRGIHLTESVRKRSNHQKYLLRDEKISASFHSLIDILRSRRKYAYVFLSPTIETKKGRQLNIGSHLEKRKSELKQIGNKQQVIALGGIKAEHFDLLSAAGFKGAALIRAIWEGDVVKNLNRLLLADPH